MTSIVLRSRGYDFYQSAFDSGEEYMIDLLATLDPEWCFDVGANCGEYSRILLRKTRSKVVAIEPLAGAYSVLSQLQSQFELQLLLFNVALGSRRETRALYYGDDFSPFASLSPEVNKIDYVGLSNVNSTEVSVETLDSLVFDSPAFSECRRIDLVKIDVEGFELEVLLGGQRLIHERRPRIIQIEFNHHHLFRNSTVWQISQLLDGYLCYQLLPRRKGLALRNPKDPLTNIFAYSNFVFIDSETATQLRLTN